MTAGVLSDESVPVAPGEEEDTLVHHFLHQVRARADRPALYFRSAGRWNGITWGQFGRASRRLLCFLIAEGLEDQEHVAIWSGNRPEWHIVDAAILCGRMRPVPVYLTLSGEQAGYVVEHSEAAVAFVENVELLGRLLEQRDQLPHLRRVVVIEGLDKPSVDGFAVPWLEALNRGEAALAAHGVEADRRAAAVALDDVATLIYTSGTTGPPKAVMLTHRNMKAAHDSLVQILTASEDDRTLSYLPLAHIVERLASEFLSYRYGNATWFLDGLPNLGERLREVRPTAFFGVPRVWEKMANAVQRGVDAAPPHRRILGRLAIETGKEVARRNLAGQPVGPMLARRHRLLDRLVLAKLRGLLGLDKARVMVSGAAPIGADVLLFFRGIGLEILEGYGQSENSAMATMNRPGQGRIGTVGTALPGVELRIAADGEILMRGPTLFAGYYKDEKATHDAVDADGWLLTGDVGELDADGYLRITDRKKDLIITAGGKNIAPGNIEIALGDHPLVSCAMAIGDQRPYVTALLTLDAEEAAAWAARNGVGTPDLASLAADPQVRAELQRHVDRVNQHLSHVEQVKRFDVLDADFAVGEELTPTMKVKRKVVLEKYADRIAALYARGREGSSEG